MPSRRSNLQQRVGPLELLAHDELRDVVDRRPAHRLALICPVMRVAVELATPPTAWGMARVARRGARSISENASWRIIAVADRKFRAAIIFLKIPSGIRSPVSKCRANRSKLSRSQHQFSIN